MAAAAQPWGLASGRSSWWATTPAPAWANGENCARTIPICSDMAEWLKWQREWSKRDRVF